MTREKAKILIIELVDRGLAPGIIKHNDDEYTITVSDAGNRVTPADLTAVIAMDIGVEINALKFT